jgi:hypothetical protein
MKKPESKIPYYIWDATGINGEEKRIEALKLMAAIDDMLDGSTKKEKQPERNNTNKENESP